VPDPVFAERMMGDGIALDPTEAVLRAPADATVIAIPETAHAATLRLANGAELLIHIGLETVALGGEGFRSLQRAGTQVKAGDPLIEFDLDAVAHRATSLVTPIVITSEGYTIAINKPSRAVRAGEPIGTVSGEGAASGPVASAECCQRTVRMDAAHGLHARPAARIASLLRPLSADVSFKLRDRSANARSTVALMGLGVRSGDEVRIVARGVDSKAAVEAIAALIESGLGEPEGAAPAASVPPIAGPVCASPGLAIGTIVQLRVRDIDVPRDGLGVAQERQRLEQARASVAKSLHGAGDSVSAELAAAHLALLDDPDLVASANSAIAEGRSAAFAWRRACEAARSAIRATGDALLMERAADLLDLERRVIAVLAGESGPAMPALPADAILIAPDLLPSQFLAIDKSRIVGICTAEGGPTSHVAILAAAAGVPMIVAAGADVLSIPEGSTAILEADHARLEANAAPERLEEVRAQLVERQNRREAEARDARDLCFTADGVRVEVFANLSSVDEARTAGAAGAEGCGLLRTEFLFLDRDTPPGEDEQAHVYAEIAAALGDRPLIVRTLDIGADKQVPYLAMAAEENPALGLRGLRLSLARPDLLMAQLRAIVGAVPAAQCRIMLPMVVELDELRQVRRILDEIAPQPIPLGIMVETPAAAMLADTIAAEADFLSVGTNDLTQYVLAADRMNAAVSARADALHPAVLRLIRQAADGARKHGRWIGVCGGLASDPIAAGILIGLGVTELSVAPAAIPAIKSAVRRLHSNACRELADRACAVASAREVRAIAAEALA
jgi:phosphocarrier protein FPr/phosphocarrier protein